MTDEKSGSLQVMLSNHELGGRIVVELSAFVTFHMSLSSQLVELEASQQKAIPQLARRVVKASRVSQE